MSDWDYQNPRLVAAKIAIPFMAWLSAIALPLMPVIAPPGPDKVQAGLALGLVLVASCYWGVRARRSGSRIAFRLMTVVPVALLATFRRKNGASGIRSGASGKHDR
jgi:hypothetical protein